jgi:hypothetical protein
MITVFLLALLAAAPPDYTKTDPNSLGIKPVKPTRDKKTGFVVAGKNPTALIRKLTEVAGRSIADLEKDMRPGALSRKGFLGKDESLLDVMAADNAFVVDRLGLTHQELARHLHVLGALAVKHAASKPLVIRYHGRRLRLQAQCWKGDRDSPFKDGTETNYHATIENWTTARSWATRCWCRT